MNPLPGVWWWTPSADQWTEITGSPDRVIITGSRDASNGCTQICGDPLRSLMKAISVQSGDRVGPQLPQAPTRDSTSSAVGCSANIVMLQPHLQ